MARRLRQALARAACRVPLFYSGWCSSWRQPSRRWPRSSTRYSENGRLPATCWPVRHTAAGKLAGDWCCRRCAARFEAPDGIPALRLARRLPHRGHRPAFTRARRSRLPAARQPARSSRAGRAKRVRPAGAARRSPAMRELPIRVRYRPDEPVSRARRPRRHRRRSDPRGAPARRRGGATLRF